MSGQIGTFLPSNFSCIRNRYREIDLKVSFRLNFSCVVLGGGGGRIALIRCAVASEQLRIVVVVFNGTKVFTIDNIQKGKEHEVLAVSFTFKRNTTE